ncbi:MAG: CDC27 family protein, partial [Paludibacter sp.]
VLYLGINQNDKLNAQEKLPLAKQLLRFNKPKQALKLISESSTDAGNSEAYFRMYAKILIRLHKFEEAIGIMKKAAQFSSAPSLFMDIAYCYELSGKMKESEKFLLLVANMVPTNYPSHFKLMKLYEKNNEQYKRLAMAHEILSLPERPNNKETSMFRILAAKTIQR